MICFCCQVTSTKDWHRSEELADEFSTVVNENVHQEALKGRPLIQDDICTVFAFCFEYCIVRASLKH